MAILVQFQHRLDTAANWTSANPVLLAGELGLDTTSGRIKIGDGTTAWNSLAYSMNKLLSGTGVPSAGLGVDGDVYVDVTAAAQKLYGPKAAGAWGAGQSIVGAQGIQGNPGNPGTNGQGVPVGGTSTPRQYLGKNTATNYDTGWFQPTLGELTVAAANTLAGNATSAPTARTDIAINASQFLARGSSGDIAAKAVTDAGLAWLAYNTVALETAALDAATASAQGMMSAQDKRKLDNIWVDVTANPLGTVNTAQTNAQNITGINAIMAAAPNGSTIYFPPNASPYLMNAAWTFPNKMFSFLGRGSNRAGSPATAFSDIRWNANVGASLMVLAGSGNGWYTTFRNLTFTTTVDQTAGTLFDANGNVGTNFDECAFQSAGGFFNDVLTFGGGAGSNSGNSASINGCNIQGFKGNGVLVNSAGSSLTIGDSVIQGQWGTTAQAATACVRAKWVGALQISDCDILGGTNNVLSDPTAANSEVCASVQCTNVYFDSAFGSSFKVAGTGATVRLKMDTCTFTTNAGGTAFSAVELAGSFVYAAGAQDLAFVNCNVYNTFGTTGATNGVLISNAADVSFTNCKIAGWANGYNVTPMASNKTNVQIIGGTVGPSGGYPGNTTGFNIVGGAYKGLQMRGVNSRGNTTNLTLGVVTVLAGEGDLFAITECAGINPKMGAALTPPVATPVSTTVYTNLTGFRVGVFFKAATTITAMSINGVATAFTASAANGSGWVTVEPGGTFAYTFTGAGSWVWVGQ